VREDYDKFLSAISNIKPGALSNQNIHTPGGNGEAGTTIENTLLDRAYRVDGESLSLQLLPPDGSNRVPEAVILLLYGFKVRHG